MTSSVRSSGRLLAAVAAAAALGGLVLIAGAAVQAQAAPTAAVQPITVNTALWTSAGSGSGPPSWYRDKSGGLTANLITTLPLAARPARTVYTIVHTFNGTFANVAIEPNGRIWILAPAPPMVTDYTFVSLESITYQP